jgi:2-oxoglutarate dehydrogenase E2 component (dihydrolipoamide succinyltransferase)
MIVEIKIPSPGESITEVEIASWLVSDGDFVEKDQEIAEIESDKATLPLLAEESGTIRILSQTGQPIRVGTVACSIDTEGKAPHKKQSAGQLQAGEADAGGRAQKVSAPGKSAGTQPGKPAGDVMAGGSATQKTVAQSQSEKPSGTSSPGDNAVPSVPGAGTGEPGNEKEKVPSGKTEGYEKVRLSPLARKLMEDEGISISDVIGGLHRITREDVAAVAGTTGRDHPGSGENMTGGRGTDRQKMSMLRRNLSRRLVAVKNETAMLTTFNEADMSNIISIRKDYQAAFTQKHGVKLGFMSFFVKAATVALKLYPNVNSYIDGDEIATPRYCDIGIAVQTDKGLMVPVIRSTEDLSLAEIESNIIGLAEKARKNRISIDDLTGGTFSITNGGIFGSLLSTPILNPPQSGILGMHNIVERPVAVNGRVEIRPMMYIALSYDHRVIDGRDSVGFLVKIREMIENPVRMLSGGRDPVGMLLDI